jgi:hypothetical protein
MYSETVHFLVVAGVTSALHYPLSHGYDQGYDADSSILSSRSTEAPGAERVVHSCRAG